MVVRDTENMDRKRGTFVTNEAYIWVEKKFKHKRKIQDSVRKDSRVLVMRENMQQENLKKTKARKIKIETSRPCAVNIRKN